MRIASVIQSLTQRRARRAGVQIAEQTFLSSRGVFAVAKDARVQLAGQVWLSAGYYLEAQAGASVTIGSRVHLGERFRLVATPGARVVIEDDCWLNHDVSIVAHAEVTIGRDCLFGPYCYLSDHNHGTARGELIRHQDYAMSPLVISADVWLGVGATLLKGASAGEGAVIAARAVVTKPVPAYEIWGGIPARKIGMRE